MLTVITANKQFEHPLTVKGHRRDSVATISLGEAQTVASVLQF